MRLTLHCCWLKSLNFLCNGSNFGLKATLSKVTLKHSQLLINKPCHKSCPIARNFYITTKNHIDRSNQHLNSDKLRNFNVQSLWENESDHTKRETNTHNAFESSHRPKRDYVRQEELLINKLDEVCKMDKITNEDWETIKTTILEIPGSINEENIDAIIMKKAAELSLPLCKSYFKHLKSTKKVINRATYGSYLQSFYICSSSCNEEDFKEILQVYEELLTVYPILDSYTAEKVVFALSLTENWKEYDKLFKDIKQIYKPSGPVYSVVIRTSFRNGEIELGWQLMEEMMQNCGRVSDDVFINWLDSSKTHEGLVRVFDFFSKFNSIPSNEVCEIILKAFNHTSDQGKGVLSTILKSGVCKHCNSKLERAWVSTEDYNNLKLAFLNPVLIGKDIFLKTQPQEFNEFLQFLERTAPYDVVLDGLNIALKMHKSKKTTKAFAVQLKNVVRHFVDQNKKVLVFGRKHMNKWPKEEFQFVRDNAHVFLADDTSQDDPFLLYATLYSGIGTCFVSHDLMRGHKFLLQDPKLQDIFKKWQAQHQYFISYIENNGVVHMEDPVQFMQTIQQNSFGDWHIPYEAKEELTTRSRVDNYHKHWLCLPNRTIQQSEMQRHYSYQRGYTPQRRQVWNDKPFRREQVARFKIPK